MIIETNNGTKVKCADFKVPGHEHSNGQPVWDDYHNRYYVWGYRMIKSKGTFSTVCTLHNFNSFTRCE